MIFELELLLIVISIVFLGLTFGYVEIDDLLPPKDSHTVNRKWHFFKGMFQGFTASSIAYPIYGIKLEMFLFMFMFLCLIAVVFNPVINKVRKRGNFFYIGKNGIEGNFYNTPKLYYFGNLTIVIISYLILNNMLW